MILRYAELASRPTVFRSMTGLSLAEFDTLAEDIVPTLVAAVAARRDRPRRDRAPGGGHPFELEHRDQLLLTVVWLLGQHGHRTPSQVRRDLISSRSAAA